MVTGPRTDNPRRAVKTADDTMELPVLRTAEHAALAGEPGAAAPGAAAPAGAPVVLDARVVTGSGGGPDKTILNSPRFLTDLGYRMVCGYLHPPDDPDFQEIVGKELHVSSKRFGTNLLQEFLWREGRGALRIGEGEK